ncbi:MAG: dCTP deaminase [Candidatus Firestonebacteria bacterium]|nr:dCTP deaminase [Candidatus Firestonebacteria bacterium]
MEENKYSNISGILSDEEITKRLKQDKNLRIFPLLREESQIKGCKVDLHLSGIFYEIKHSSIEVHDPINYSETDDYRRDIVLPINKPYTLHPNMFVLASTFENISMPNDLLGILEGKSSLGRLGIIVHATASFIDPGYNGTITLELSNLGQLPVNLYTLAPIASIAFITIQGKVKFPYGAEMESPISSLEKEPHGHHDSPISQPSKYGADWEFRILKIIKERTK